VWSSVRTVLIVDQDLGFVFWLGRALDAIGFNALPAKDPGDARRLVDELNVRADVLVADFSADGVEALAHYLCEENPTLRMVSTAAGATGHENVHLCLEKPEFPDEEAQRNWVRGISGLFGAAGSS
jgi:hypothetical protein